MDCRSVPADLDLRVHHQVLVVLCLSPMDMLGRLRWWVGLEQPPGRPTHCLLLWGLLDIQKVSQEKNTVHRPLAPRQLARQGTSHLSESFGPQVLLYSCRLGAVATLVHRICEVMCMQDVSVSVLGPSPSLSSLCIVDSGLNKHRAGSLELTPLLQGLPSITATKGHWPLS